MLAQLCACGTLRKGRLGPTHRKEMARPRTPVGYGLYATDRRV